MFDPAAKKGRWMKTERKKSGRKSWTTLKKKEEEARKRRGMIRFLLFCVYVCKLIRLLHPHPPSYAPSSRRLDCVRLWAASLPISSDDDPWSICTQRLFFFFFFFSFFLRPLETEPFRGLLTAPNANQENRRERKKIKR